MASYDFEYDSEVVRREAKKIKKACDYLEQSAVPESKKAQELLDGNFIGLTADALNEQLNRLNANVVQLKKDLNRMYRVLIQFAEELERRDAELARTMNDN